MTDGDTRTLQQLQQWLQTVITEPNGVRTGIDVARDQFGNAPEDIYRTFHTGLRSIMPSFDGQTLMTVAGQGFPPQEGLLEPGELDRLQPALADFPQTVSAVFDLSNGEQQKLGVRNSWDLVAYIRSLRQTETTAAAVLGTPAEGATP